MALLADHEGQHDRQHQHDRGIDEPHQGVVRHGLRPPLGGAALPNRDAGEYQRHWGPPIVWLGAGGGMFGSLVWGPGVACLGAAWGS